MLISPLSFFWVLSYGNKRGKSRGRKNGLREEKTMGELMFYGGIAVTAVSLAVLLIFLCVIQVIKMRLDLKLDEEYGKRKKKK